MGIGFRFLRDGILENTAKTPGMDRRERLRLVAGIFLLTLACRAPISWVHSLLVESSAG